MRKGQQAVNPAARYRPALTLSVGSEQDQSHASLCQAEDLLVPCIVVNLLGALDEGRDERAVAAREGGELSSARAHDAGMATDTHTPLVKGRETAEGMLSVVVVVGWW